VTFGRFVAEIWRYRLLSLQLW